MATRQRHKTNVDRLTIIMSLMGNKSLGGIRISKLFAYIPKFFFLDYCIFRKFIRFEVHKISNIFGFTTITITHSTNSFRKVFTFKDESVYV